MAGLLSRYFDVAARSTDLATEIRAGFTTFMVMAFIGAGFVTFAVIKLLRGRGRELHWMIYLACAAFVVYFCR